MLTLTAPNPLTPSHQPEFEASTCDLPSDWSPANMEVRKSEGCELNPQSYTW